MKFENDINSLCGSGESLAGENLGNGPSTEEFLSFFTNTIESFSGDPQGMHDTYADASPASQWDSRTFVGETIPREQNYTLISTTNVDAKSTRSTQSTYRSRLSVNRTVKTNNRYQPYHVPSQSEAPVEEPATTPRMSRAIPAPAQQQQRSHIVAQNTDLPATSLPKPQQGAPPQPYGVRNDRPPQVGYLVGTFQPLLVYYPSPHLIVPVFPVPGFVQPLYAQPQLVQYGPSSGPVPPQAAAAPSSTAHPQAPVPGANGNGPLFTHFQVALFPPRQNQK